MILLVIVVQILLTNSTFGTLLVDNLLNSWIENREINETTQTNNDVVFQTTNENSATTMETKIEFSFTVESITTCVETSSPATSNDTENFNLNYLWLITLLIPLAAVLTLLIIPMKKSKPIGKSVQVRPIPLKQINTPDVV